MKKISIIFLILLFPIISNAQKTPTKANEDEIKSLFTQGVNLSEQNKTDEAINVFLTLIKKYPDIPEPYNNLAVLYIEKNNTDLAIKALQEAIKIDPTYYVAKENLGDIYLKLATDSYSSSLKGNPENKAITNKIQFAQQALNNNSFDTFSKDTLVAKNETATTNDIKPNYTNNAKIQLAENIPAPVLQNKPVVIVKPTPVTSPKTVVVASDPNPIRPIKKADDIVRITPLPKEDPVIATKAPINQEGDIKKFIANWSNAWQSKDVESYLASYDNSFETPDNSSLDSWKDMRKDRINKPANIDIDISDTSIKMTNYSEAIVSFKQAYQAGSYKDKSLKTLTLVKKNNQWYIKREISAKV